MDDTTDQLDLDAIRARSATADAIDYFGAEYARAVEASQADVPALLAEVDRLRSERDALAVELDRDRHEHRPSFYGDGSSLCSECGHMPRSRSHRTSRVVLAEQTEK